MYHVLLCAGLSCRVCPPACLLRALSLSCAVCVQGLEPAYVQRFPYVEFTTQHAQVWPAPYHPTAASDPQCLRMALEQVRDLRAPNVTVYLCGWPWDDQAIRAQVSEVLPTLEVGGRRLKVGLVLGAVNDEMLGWVMGLGSALDTFQCDSLALVSEQHSGSPWPWAKSLITTVHMGTVWKLPRAKGELFVVHFKTLDFGGVEEVRLVLMCVCVYVCHAPHMPAAPRHGMVVFEVHVPFASPVLVYGCCTQSALCMRCQYSYMHACCPHVARIMPIAHSMPWSQNDLWASACRCLAGSRPHRQSLAETHKMAAHTRRNHGYHSAPIPPPARRHPEATVGCPQSGALRAQGHGVQGSGVRAGAPDCGGRARAQRPATVDHTSRPYPVHMASGEQRSPVRSDPHYLHTAAAAKQLTRA